MKRISCIILTLLIIANTFAQSISISSFKLLDTDLTANTAGTMEMDQNGETAALIKVVTTQTGFTFDGGAMGIVKTKQTPSEVWVYIPRGSKKISIKHPQLGVLRDYYFPVAIEAARTYEMVLVAGEVKTIVKQAGTSQYVVFQLNPENAQVEIDGIVLETNKGIATKMMKFGTYNYRVQAPNYLPEAGNVTVNDPTDKHVVNVSLKPNFSVVTLKVENESEIWVNGEYKGIGSWTGNLSPGTYEFEARKQNQRSVSLTQDILISSEPQIIVLQAPIPVFGKADINSSPAMADIYIDGKKYGQTPQLVTDLPVGQHQLRITKQGFRDYSSLLDIKEDETASLTAQLEESKNILTIAAGDLSFNMIFVEKGAYEMGIPKMNLYDRNKYHNVNVSLSSFYIGETEVTQELWESIMGKNPSIHKNRNAPVENVNWYDCQKFIKKLNKLTGLEFRLPTDAEWEFAAHGGNMSRDYVYSGSNDINEIAWCDENTWHTTCKVKQKKPNELGIFDMSGNVAELVDWYVNPYLWNAKERERPYSARGGCWKLAGKYCSIKGRLFTLATEKVDYIGLRIVLDKGK